MTTRSVNHLPRRDPVVVPGNIIVNPGANQVLVQSAALDPGRYEVLVVVHIPPGGDLILERRDSTNTSNIWSQILGIDGRHYETNLFLAVEANETIRIETLAGLTGSLQASLFITRIP